MLRLIPKREFIKEMREVIINAMIVEGRNYNARAIKLRTAKLVSRCWPEYSQTGGLAFRKNHVA